MIYERGIWSFEEPPFEDGDIINGCNVSQLAPDTVICAGLRVTINGGNWVNVKPDPLWTINGGNWTQVDRCSHLYPKWVKRGLPKCAERCKHMQGAGKQTVEIPEEEFRQLKRDGDLTLQAETLAPDADGVPVVKLTKEAYVYQDNRVGDNRPRVREVG